MASNTANIMPPTPAMTPAVTAVYERDPLEFDAVGFGACGGELVGVAG